MKSGIRSALAVLVVAFGAQTQITRAEIVSTNDVAAKSQSESDRAKVQSFLDRANVKERLQALGLNASIAKDRVASLSDAEVASLAQKIDGMPAGGDLSKYDLIIILLVVVLIAIVI
jgi:hypothetical protein